MLAIMTTDQQQRHVDGRRATAARRAPARATAVRLLRLATFTSTFDRFSTPPLLVVMAADLGGSLASVTRVATLYYLGYGVGQAFWGIVSDRLGRVRTMRLTLAGSGLLGLTAALAPGLGPLLVARGLQGLLFGAVIPSAVVYVGDTFPMSERQRPMSLIVGASAQATAVATLAAGVAADVLSWRVALAVPAALALVLAVVLRALPEPARSAPEPALGQFARVLHSGWARLVLCLGFVEGGAMLGAITFLAPALQSRGSSATVAGAVVAVYGVGVFGGSRLLAVLADRVPVTRLMGLGGALLALGLAAPAVSLSVPSVAGGVLVAGVGFGLLHANLQAWATDLVPEARATAVSLFVTSLFAGSALGTALLTPLAGAGRFSLLFAVCAAALVPMLVAAVSGRGRYDAARARAPGAEIEPALPLTGADGSSIRMQHRR